MSRKSNVKKWLALMVIAMLSIGFASCSDDDDNGDPNNGQPVNPNTPVNDPEGTITISMRNENSGKTYFDNCIYIDNANNFMSDWGSQAEFVSLGEVKGLGNVSNIPLVGWASKVACIPGHGYVAYNKSEDIFYRLYVVENTVSTTGGIIGADIKYQKPFKGMDEMILLSEKTLTIPAESSTENVIFNNKNIVLFSVESNQQWCHVQKTSSKDHYFLYDGISISCEENFSSTPRKATLTLTTLFNRSIDIKVSQSAMQLEGDGTKDAPFNILAAIDYANNLTVGSERDKIIYIKGTISHIDNVTLTTFGSYASFYMSQNAIMNQRVYVQRAQYNGDGLQVGDNVIICGTIINLNGAYNVQSAKIYSQNGQFFEIDSEGSGSGTKEDPFDVIAATLYTEQLGNDVESLQDIYIKGRVCHVAEEFSTQYGNGTFYISNPNSSYPQFYAYRVLYLGNKMYNGGMQVYEGDDVVISGKVINFRGNTPETVQGKAYLYSLNGRTE